jgi:hypothetical protein
MADRTGGHAGYMTTVPTLDDVFAALRRPG